MGAAFKRERPEFGILLYLCGIHRQLCFYYLAGQKQYFLRPCLMLYAFILCPLFLHFHGHLNAKLIVCQGPNKVPLKLLVGYCHD